MGLVGLCDRNCPIESRYIYIRVLGTGAFCDSMTAILCFNSKPLWQHLAAWSQATPSDLKAVEYEDIAEAKHGDCGDGLPRNQESGTYHRLGIIFCESDDVRCHKVDPEPVISTSQLPFTWLPSPKTSNFPSLWCVNVHHLAHRYWQPPLNFYPDGCISATWLREKRWLGDLRRQGRWWARDELSEIFKNEVCVHLVLVFNKNLRTFASNSNQTALHWIVYNRIFHWSLSSVKLIGLVWPGLSLDMLNEREPLKSTYCDFWRTVKIQFSCFRRGALTSLFWDMVSTSPFGLVLFAQNCFCLGGLEDEEKEAHRCWGLVQ